MYQKQVGSQFKTDIKVYRNKPLVIQELERIVDVLAE